jgi:predicted nuclease of predicted toxin-antitoxin system
MLDANLSRRLVPLFSDVFPGSVHASILGPAPEDEAIWDYAKTNGFIVVSKDSDFYRLSVAWGAPPKVVWLRIGNGPTRFVEQILRSRLDAISSFAGDADAALLIVDLQMT